MKIVMRTYLGLVERYLAFRKRLVFNPSGKKTALVSFVLFPPRWNRRYLLASHNNRLTCKIMVDVLVARGFRVHLQTYLDQTVPDRDIDLFIGHNVTFHQLAQRMPSGCTKMLVTSGSNPRFDNEVLAARTRDFCRRNAMDVPFRPLSDAHVRPNVEAADRVMMLGNAAVIATWPPDYAAKRVAYHNITLFRPARKKGRGRTFLYMSSIGVLRRGLDLVIEAFEGADAELIICSPYEGEQWFFDHYAPAFARCPNIRFHGYVDTGSALFRDIIDSADFAILPSCSEGESGSALNMMTLGLLPVITENVGFADVPRYGFLIEEATVAGIRTLVERILESGDAEIEAKRTALFAETAKYQPEVFSSDFADICDRLGFPAQTPLQGPQRPV